MSPEALWVVLPGLLLLLYLSSRADRQRIRQHVESAGGTVLRLARAGWLHRRRFEVQFRPRSGGLTHAVCQVSLMGGLEWLERTEEAEVLDGPSTGGRIAEVEALQEPAPCLACGAEIPPRRARCPYCGWSYKEG